MYTGSGIPALTRASRPGRVLPVTVTTVTTVTRMLPWPHRFPHWFRKLWSRPEPNDAAMATHWLRSDSDSSLRQPA